MIRLIILSILSASFWVPDLVAQESPYGGTPWPIPGIIEAENYDLGGEGVAYHDLDADNQGGQYRPSEGVDIEQCSEGGYNVGWISTGEWIRYTVSVLKTGVYKLRMRVASTSSGGIIHVSFNDKDVTDEQAVPNTGAWQQWVWLDVPHIELDSGVQVMKLGVDVGGYNVTYLQFIEDIDFGALPELPNYSAEHGFYTNPFDLVISCDSAGSVIHYTMDGSDPKEDTTASSAPSPVTVRIDPSLTQGRAATPAVVVRAYATVNGTPVTNSASQTYIFIDQVRDQEYPGGNWPEGMVNSKVLDYDMDPDVVNDPRYKDLIEDALLEIPTICINTDLKNLFDPTIGIYVNPTGHGTDWERPASIELIDPHKKEKGFQINAGLRIRGGYSRIPTGRGGQYKHAFRFFFRSEYGQGKLDYPLFQDEGVSKFDCVDLRTAQNYSWSYMSNSGHINTFLRDIFSRDSQREMGKPYTRSRYYHLYIDGMYWGLYQTEERPEASYGESYFGGNKEDYDVIKVIPTADGVQVTDGTLDSYYQFCDLANSGFETNEAYFKVQGKNPDGSVNLSYPAFANLDNLIDYMLIIFYTGNFDAPVSAFIGNQRPNNFYCIYSHLNRDGFLFFEHDAEHSIMDPRYSENSDYGLDRTGPYFGSTCEHKYFNPQFLHEKLSKNQEYRVLFSDHIYKHFFNKGILTPQKSQQRLITRSHEIDTAIIAESARWGDAHWDPPRTKDDDWLPAVNWIINSYFPSRTQVVLQELKDDNLYPSIDPPLFMSGSEEIQDETHALHAGDKIRLVNPNGSQAGSILYTLDGTDPRVIGGSTSSSASDAGDDIELTINYSTVLKARVKNGSTWSALHEISLNTGEALTGLRITEINYNPLPDSAVDGKEFEFIELKNVGSTPLSLAGAHFIQGIEYTFPNGPLVSPNSFVVLASNSGMFQKRYGFSPAGQYSHYLDNAGERITLVSADGDTIFTVRYNDKAPWPESADGDGYSIVAKNINGYGNPDSAEYWRASSDINGSPDRDDISTGIKDTRNQRPNTFVLHQNYPNPFNPSTKITFEIPEYSVVSLTVYSILGRRVAEITNGKFFPGVYSFSWNGSSVASGVYLLKMNAQSSSGKTYSSVKKLVLLK
jgi:hypothetical protein